MSNYEPIVKDRGDADLCRWVRENGNEELVLASNMVTSALLRACTNANVLIHPQVTNWVFSCFNQFIFLNLPKK